MHLSPVDFLFSHPCDGESARRQTSHRICRSAVSATRAIHQSFHPHPPVPYGPGTANEILQRRTAERTRIPLVSGPSRACSVRTMRACARSRVDVWVSPPPKRIRGKRARRWINTKTSVTHDQPRPLFHLPSRPPLLRAPIAALCARRYRRCARPAGCTSRSIPLEIIQTNYR